MTYPANYRYTREHEWIEIEGKTGRIGVTDYAQQSLGDVVFVDLPQVGSKVEQGKSFGSVESVKSVSELYSPVTGTVTAVNEDLAKSPEKVNADPYGSWMIKVEIAEPSVAAALLNAADYEKYVREEAP